MASIHKVMLQSNKVRYRIRVRTCGRSASATMPNRAEARRWAAEKERQFTLCRLSPLGRSEVVTVGQVIDRYVREVLRYKKLNTRRQQEQQLEWWKWLLGEDTALVDVTTPVVALAKERLLPRAPSTINRYLAVLSHVFTTAVKEWQLAEVNPVTNVVKLPEGRERTRVLSRDEREKLLFACSTSGNRYLYTIVVLALSTGARKTELRTIRPAQVNIGANRIYLEETKTDEARALVLYGEALRVMTKVMDELPAGARYCFPSPFDRHRPVDFRTAWETAVEKAGLHNFCFHDLRHTEASYLGGQGASLAQIGAILGHSSAKTTKKYTHFTNSGVEHLVEKMNRSVFRGRA